MQIGDYVTAYYGPANGPANGRCTSRKTKTYYGIVQNISHFCGGAGSAFFDPAGSIITVKVFESNGIKNERFWMQCVQPITKDEFLLHLLER